MDDVPGKVRAHTPMCAMGPHHEGHCSTFCNRCGVGLVELDSRDVDWCPVCFDIMCPQCAVEHRPDMDQGACAYRDPSPVTICRNVECLHALADHSSGLDCQVCGQQCGIDCRPNGVKDLVRRREHAIWLQAQRAAGIQGNLDL